MPRAPSRAHRGIVLRVGAPLECPSAGHRTRPRGRPRPSHLRPLRVGSCRRSGVRPCPSGTDPTVGRCHRPRRAGARHLWRPADLADRVRARSPGWRSAVVRLRGGDGRRVDLLPWPSRAGSSGRHPSRSRERPIRLARTRYAGSYLPRHPVQQHLGIKRPDLAARTPGGGSEDPASQVAVLQVDVPVGGPPRWSPPAAAPSCTGWSGGPIEGS
jgi:hypothetical protein